MRLEVIANEDDPPVMWASQEATHTFCVAPSPFLALTADTHCRAPADGSPVQLCLELGVTQNAYIVECGGAHARDPHCGTYLEVREALVAVATYLEVSGDGVSRTRY